MVMKRCCLICGRKPKSGDTDYLYPHTTAEARRWQNCLKAHNVAVETLRRCSCVCKKHIAEAIGRRQNRQPKQQQQQHRPQQPPDQWIGRNVMGKNATGVPMTSMQPYWPFVMPMPVPMCMDTNMAAWNMRLMQQLQRNERDQEEQGVQYPIERKSSVHLCGGSQPTQQRRLSRGSHAQDAGGCNHRNYAPNERRHQNCCRYNRGLCPGVKCTQPQCMGCPMPKPSSANVPQLDCQPSNYPIPMPNAKDSDRRQEEYGEQQQLRPQTINNGQQEVLSTNINDWCVVEVRSRGEIMEDPKRSSVKCLATKATSADLQAASSFCPMTEPVNVLLMSGATVPNYCESSMAINTSTSTTNTNICVLETDLAHECATFPDIDEARFVVLRTPMSDSEISAQPKESNPNCYCQIEECTDVILMDKAKCSNDEFLCNCRPSATVMDHSADFNWNEQLQCLCNKEQQNREKYQPIIDMQKARIQELEDLLMQQKLLQETIEQKVDELNSVAMCPSQQNRKLAIYEQKQVLKDFNESETNPSKCSSKRVSIV